MKMLKLVVIFLFGFQILSVQGECSYEETLGFVCRNITNIADMKLSSYEYPPKEIIILNTNIPIIQSNAFKDKILYTLEEFDIFNCTIKSIEQFAFKGLNKLRLLYLENNNISTINKNAFFGLTNVIHLNLQHNNIATLASSTLTGLADLTDLNLSHNIIESIDGDTFHPISALESIDLSFNRLITLDGELFKNKKRLEYISLSHNLLKEIPELVFEDVTNLRTLRLESNHLTELKQDVFAGLNNLENLYLQHNDIHKVDVYSFKFWWFTGNLNNLVYLDVSHNKLTTQLWCSKCNKLKELKLNDNRLKSYTIDVSQNLEVLDLSNNAIETLMWGSTNRFRYRKQTTVAINLLSNPVNHFGIGEVPLLLLHLRLKIILDQQLPQFKEEFKYRDMFEYRNNTTENCTSREAAEDYVSDENEELVFVNAPGVEFYPEEIAIKENCSSSETKVDSGNKGEGLYSGKVLLWTCLGSVLASCILTNILIYVIFKIKAKRSKIVPENVVGYNPTESNSVATIHL